ncbi:MAG: hypothetical protein JSR52_04550 [Planctomycetes bacterium]|nr:hypothetical protein [Planctomycetota bacterium]
MSAGQAATRRWFPDEADLQRRVDAILHEVMRRRCDESERKSSTPSQELLFADIPASASPRKLRGRAVSLNQIVSQAYLAMIRSIPEDHVVIEPSANQEFVSRCRLLGANVSEFSLNKALLNVRKAGQLHRGLNRSNESSVLNRQALDRVGYAAEIAARVVQLRAIESGADQPTVDRILCDPTLRELFDEAVQSAATGFSLYECRLAAFSYRKSGRASAQRLSDVSMPEWDVNDASFRTLDPDDAPAKPGVYRVDAGAQTLFVSATLNLRDRLVSHLAASDGQSLIPPSLWDPPRGKLVVRWFEAPVVWRPRRADAVAQRMKVEEKAMYNLYARTG